MTGSEKLRKENQALRNEISDLRGKLEEISKDLAASKVQQVEDGAHVAGRDMSPGRMQSVEFVSSQYDQLVAFKKDAMTQIKQLTTRVNEISIVCERISKAIDALEAYSYQYNIKIVGVPIVTERETPEQTANLCSRLFSALGVPNVSITDIDTAHRVPSRTASARPNAIVCKFVRRLAKEQVMAARREVVNVQASQLGFQERVDIQHIALYDHLTPRLQELLYEGKKFQTTNGFKFCWAKNGFVFLRKTDSSPVLKLSSLEDLRALMEHSG